jgi:hypothetical protein
MYGLWRYSSTILELGIRWRWVVSFTPWLLYTRGKSPRYPLVRRMCGPQSRSERYGQQNTRLELNPSRQPVALPTELSLRFSSKCNGRENGFCISVSCPRGGTQIHNSVSHGTPWPVTVIALGHSKSSIISTCLCMHDLCTKQTQTYIIHYDVYFRITFSVMYYSWLNYFQLTDSRDD